jgi:zinc protease
MSREPPTDDEVQRTVEETTNGFVFNFETPAQIVSRATLYRIDDLPVDWLDRYLEGIQGISAADVHEAFRAHVHAERMVILVIGDPESFDEPLDVLGPVTVLPGGVLPFRPEGGS